MKKILPLLMLLMYQAASFAQQETLDYVSYTPPAGWKKDINSGATVYSIINKKKWCQIGVYKAIVSKGNIELDFENEWNTNVQPLGVTDTVQTTAIQELEGWKIKNGTGHFLFNGSTVSASLTTFSGYNVCFSILANSSSSDYAQTILDFMSSVQLSKPESSQPDQTGSGTDSSQATTATTALKDKYTFNTTNFEDGWVSTVQPDWVEVTKGSIKVLLHYPKEGTMYPADADKLTSNAWNILVAPRYSNIQNYKFISPSGDDGSLASKIAMASMTEKSSGKSVFVVLFNRTAGWTEVIVPDVKTFTGEFGFDPTSVRFGTNSHNWGGWIVTTSTGATVDANGGVFTKLDAMLLKNKFAVSDKDLYGTGEWAQNFNSNTFWANAYNGVFEGVSTYSSSKGFVFGSGQSYQWDIIMVNTYGGATSGVKTHSAGTFRSLGNWQLYFSDIEGKPKKYDVYFTVIKGGRILWMNDAEHPGSGIFDGFSKN